MKTVGQLLRETRELQFYSLEDVERKTKIRKEMLEALEDDDYDKLPPATFVQGFIKNYGKLLGLPQDKLLALWRRDYEARKHPPHVMKSFSSPLKTPKFRVTPQYILAVVVTLVVASFFGYLWFEYREFVGAPMLTVSSPGDQQTVDIPQVVIEGQTAPEMKVTVNDQEVLVDKEGRFRQEIQLSGVSNKITVASIGRFGQRSVIERVVFVRK